jgi:uncharacterized protein YndB with AHSA1/START domain
VPDRVERELFLTASPEDVWELVTHPGRWLADDAALDLRPGGDAWFRIGEDVRTGWVEEVARGQRLSFWWADDDEPATRVELTLEELDVGTRLRVVETRPLDKLDLVGIPLRGIGGASYGPALVAA